ncbi:MAG: hypothetical protein IT472_07660 [Thermomonas sp.]|uniref:hypothetical protein n=1 Tax=Thermomonas sp. TaxID=1971895 RepID=UPI002634F097|nr:hypothetical protein [Thermomonas sp.]MCC7097038.1 hypothetical protein [Thermomonas sp.]
MAARKNATTRAPRNEILDVNPRHVWLAALGGLVVARRGIAGALHQAGLRMNVASADARDAMRQFDTTARAGIEGLNDRIQPFLCPIGRTVQAGIAPLAERVGLKLGAKHAERRKAATTKTRTGRSAARKPVARRKAAAAR